MLVAFSPAIAIVLLLLPGIGYLLTRRLGGLMIGLSLVLLVPAWTTLGATQASVLRVAALCAIATVLLGRRIRLTWIDFSLFGFILIIVLGWLLQNDQPNVGRITLNLILPTAFFLAARAIPPKDVPRVMSYVFFVGAFAALTVLYELNVGRVVFVDPTVYYWNGSNANIFRPGGVFGSPPAASTVLTLTALCGLPLVRQCQGWQRGMVVFGMALTLLAVLATFTRAALIAFALALIAYLWLTRSPVLKPRYVLPALIVCTLTFVVLFPRLERETTVSQGVLRQGTFSARVDYWQLALPIATSSVQNLLVGIGTAAAEVPTIGGSAPSKLAASPDLINHGTHNQYVHTFLEQGLVGLLALLAWLITTIATAARYAYTRNNRNAAALAAGGLAFAVIMVVNNVILNAPSLAMGMLISGMIVALNEQSRPMNMTRDQEFP